MIAWAMERVPRRGIAKVPPQQMTNGQETAVPIVLSLSDDPASRPLNVVLPSASRPVRNSAVVVLVCGRHVGYVRRRWRRRRPACWTRRLCRGRWLARRRSRDSNGRGCRAECSARFSVRATRGRRRCWPACSTRRLCRARRCQGVRRRSRGSDGRDDTTVLIY